jgi:eukaryotic-like serine/threonine-protein kinase
VAAYEVLTLVKPFDGNSAREIVEAQLKTKVTAPRDLNAEIPPALEKIILKCLECEPEKRYPNMTVVVRDLQSTLYV